MHACMHTYRQTDRQTDIPVLCIGVANLMMLMIGILTVFINFVINVLVVVSTSWIPVSCLEAILVGVCMHFTGLREKERM